MPRVTEPELDAQPGRTACRGNRTRADRGEAGVAGGGRAAGFRPPDQRRAVPGGDSRDGGLIGRAVVHHEHRVRAAERRQAAIQFLRPVADGDQHGDVGRGRRGRGPRMGQPGVGEPPGERPAGR